MHDWGDDETEAGGADAPPGPAPSSDLDLDLSDEVPAERALDISGEVSRIAIGLDLTKIGFTGLDYTVRGPASLVATFTVVVIAEAVVAAVLVPLLVLAADAGNVARTATAAVSGGLVLAAGAAALICLFGTMQRRIR